MILLIMLFTLICIGLLGILVVVTYACVTTKSLHTFCISFIKRQPTPIKYAADDDYAERTCETLDKHFQNTIEQEESVNLSAISSDDEARMDDCHPHHHHKDGQPCDCTDYDDSETGFDSPRSTSRHPKDVVKFNAPLVGVIV